MRSEVNLDDADVAKLNEAMQAIKALEQSGAITVRTLTFTLYDEHRVRVSRRGRSWWNPLKITKIERTA